MKKLNDEQRKLVDNARAEILVLNTIIDAKYLNLVDALGKDLSEDMEGWLFDYVYNPEWGPELAIENLFE